MLTLLYFSLIDRQPINRNTIVIRTQEDGTYAATVFHSEKTGYHIEYWGQSNDLADIPRGVARAYFRMDINTTG